MSKTEMTWIGWVWRQVWWQIRAAWFGIVYLAAIIGTALVWPEGAVARYDALFLFGILVLGALFVGGAHRSGDLIGIAVLAALGLALEVHKTAIGRWAYPGDGVMMVGSAPAFTALMYAAVGSYLVRAMRIKDLRVDFAPPLAVGLVVAAVIYGAFFVPVMPPWVRMMIVGIAMLALWRARIVAPSDHFLPLPVALAMAAGLIWVAENIGTFTGTWIYQGQAPLELVHPGKITSWFLLLNVCFLLVIYTVKDLAKGHGQHE